MEVKSRLKEYMFCYGKDRISLLRDKLRYGCIDIEKYKYLIGLRNWWFMQAGSIKIKNSNLCVFGRAYDRDQHKDGEFFVTSSVIEVK